MGTGRILGPGAFYHFFIELLKLLMEAWKFSHSSDDPAWRERTREIAYKSSLFVLVSINL